MKPAVHQVQMTGESPLSSEDKYTRQELIHQCGITIHNLQNGINLHIRDPQLKMCMCREAAEFLGGIQNQWTANPVAKTDLSTPEYMSIVTHLGDAAGRFFAEGVKLGEEALSLYGGVSQVLTGTGLLFTPAWPLGLVLVYQGVGNTGGGISDLVNLSASTHYDWNITKKLDEIVLGKKQGAMTFDAIDLGSSASGLMRLSVKSNEFGMPIRKLYRKDPINYIREFKNASKRGLFTEIVGDIYTAESSEDDFR